MPELVIVAIFRDEARYIKEWCQHNFKIGASKIYLYDNGSVDDYNSQIAEFGDKVEIIPWHMRNSPQMPAYQHFIDNNKQKAVWSAFLDLDEFLWSPTKKPVVDILNYVDRPYAYGVNWVVFGSNGETTLKDIPVLQRFRTRPPLSHPANLHIKSIIRMDQFVATNTPHYFITNSGTYQEDGTPIFGSFSEKHMSNYLRINHYCTKSRAEWDKRQLKGKADRSDFVSRPEQFDEVQSQECFDYGIMSVGGNLK
jgi:hypothetical protein